MKKIGIFTYGRYYNYGTVLQAYALQNFISRHHACDVEIIDYVAKNEYVGKKLVLTRLKRSFRYLKDFKKYYVLYKNRHCEELKKHKFDEFFKSTIRFSEKVSDLIESHNAICDSYDAIIVGSDQTWNPFVSTKGVFLLEWVDAKKITKLAYAPSMGISRLPQEYAERYYNALSSFEALSCRERGGALFLSELLGKKVEFVLDPTLLLKPEDWEDIAMPINMEEPYLLTYFLGDNKNHRKVAQRIAKEGGMKIVSIPISYLEIEESSIEDMYIGPREFVSLIKNASFVCTDSFHGTMFSINFNKNFISFPKRNDIDVNSDNNRIYDALDVFGLSERVFIGELPQSLNIDYTNTNKILSKLRASSYDYLTKALSCIKDKEK